MKKLLKGLALAAAVAVGAAARADVLWTYNSESNTITEIVESGTPWVFTVTAAGSVTGMTPGSNLTVDLRQETMPDDAPVIKTWGFATNSSYGYNYLNMSAEQLPWTTFYFPEGVTSLGYMAVYNWKSITTLVLPPNLTSIGEYCFERSAGVDLVLPDTVTWIGKNAFNSSGSLKTVKMPANLSSCGSSIFSSCGSLREITWPAWCGGWKGTSNAAWSDKNVRYLVPGSNATWMATIADPAFVTYWDDVASADQSAYYTRYGSDAAKPYGLSVSGKLPGAVAKTWIVVQEAVANRAYIHVTAPSSTFGTLSYSPAPDSDGTWAEGTEVTISFAAASGVSILGWSGNVPAGKETASSFTITASGTKALALTCVTDSYTYLDGTLSDGSVTLSATVDSALGYTVTSLDAVGLGGLVDLTKPIVGGGSVIAIGTGAFKNNTSVQRVVLPDDLQTIGNDAFCGCTALLSLTPALPKGLRTLGYEAFSGCTALTNGFEIGFGTNAETQAMIPLTINLNNTTDRNAYLFPNCYKIPYLKWGPAVTEVPREGARYMSSLTNIEFGINVRYVREFYSYGCDKIATVQCLSTNLMTFTYKSFSSCFPSSVREIVWNGWYETRDSSSQLGSWADKNCRFIVPGDSTEWLNFITTYVEPWSSLDETTQQYYYTRYGSDAKTPAGLSQIVAGRHNRTWIVKTDVELAGCMLLTPTVNAAFGTVTVSPAPRASDGLYAPDTDVTVTFTPATGVTFKKWTGDVSDENAAKSSFTFAITNTTTLAINFEADFYIRNGTQLTDGMQTFTATKSASGYAVTGATTLSSDGVLNLDKQDTNGLKVVSIGSSAFAGQVGVTKLILPDGLTSLGSSAFSGCTGIREVVNFLPRGLTWIGNASFNGCSAITNVAWIGYGTNESTHAAINVEMDHSSSSDYNSCLFNGCSKLPAIHYGPGVVTVHRFAVNGCSKLGEIEMSVNTITNREYYSGASGITNVVCHATNTMNFTCQNVGTFNGCGNLRQIVWDGWFNIACGGVFMSAADKKCRFVVPGDHLTWLGFIADSSKVQPWSELTASVQQEYYDRYGEDEHLIPCGLAYAVSTKYNRVWIVKTDAELPGNALTIDAPNAAFGSVTVTPQPGASGLYEDGTEVTVTLTLEEGVTFNGWSGDVPEGHENDLTFTFAINATTSLKANVLADFFVYDNGHLLDGVQDYEATGATSTLALSKLGTMLSGGIVDLSKPIRGCTLTKINSLICNCCDAATTYSVKELYLPDTITYFGDRAFDCCRTLTKVSPLFPRDITYVGYSIFTGNWSLTGDVTLGYAVDSAGDPKTVSFGYYGSDQRSFLQDYSIGPCVKLGPGVVTVPRGLIQNGESVTNILIDGSTAVADYAFQELNKNCDIVFTGDMPTMTANAFNLKSGSSAALRACFSVIGHSEWNGFVTNETKVARRHALDASAKASFWSRWPKSQGYRRPYGRTLTGRRRARAACRRTCGSCATRPRAARSRCGRR